MDPKALLRRGLLSLVGHIVLAEIIFSVPMAAMFLFDDISQGELAAPWTLYSLFMWGVVGAVLGTSVWFTMTRPYLPARGLIQ